MGKIKPMKRMIESRTRMNLSNSSNNNTVRSIGLNSSRTKRIVTASIRHKKTRKSVIPTKGKAPTGERMTTESRKRNSRTTPQESSNRITTLTTASHRLISTTMENRTKIMTTSNITTTRRCNTTTATTRWN